MTSDVAGQAPPDPIGAITRLVAEAEPALAVGLIQDIVIGVAGGRAKRRRLAQALVQRPAVLRDGRSPAPRAVGDLLIALRRAWRPGRVAAMLRGMRQTAAHPAAQGPGLVLRGLRRPARNLFGVREEQGDLHPGPAGRAASSAATRTTVTRCWC